MSTKKKILIALAVAPLVLIALVLLLVGPWPCYTSDDFQSTAYYRAAVAQMDQAAKESECTPTPGRLQAGWASRSIVPPIGTPLAGYGARKGGPSTGVHDEIFVKAIALSDGRDNVVILGADILIIPPNVMEGIEKAVTAQTPLRRSNIMVHASHTHCGPGAFAPGLMAKTAAGDFDPAVEALLVKAFSEAAVEAFQAMKPAKMAQGTVNAKEYIRNRTRKADIDPTLSFALFTQDAGPRCYMVRFSAHPTIYGDDMMEFSAEYPGALQRKLEQEPNTTAVYLGGALGSMSNQSPTPAEKDEKIKVVGEGLAGLVAQAIAAAPSQDSVDIASVVIDAGLPSPQMRPMSASWRLSPVLTRIIGLPKTARVQAAHIGSIMLVGMPFDFSGELSIAWQGWATEHGFTAWPTGFSGTYCGYLSPAVYYNETNDKGELGYEVGLMNWFGPGMPGYAEALYQHAAQVLCAEKGEAK